MPDVGQSYDNFEKEESTRYETRDVIAKASNYLDGLNKRLANEPDYGAKRRSSKRNRRKDRRPAWNNDLDDGLGGEDDNSDDAYNQNYGKPPPRRKKKAQQKRKKDSRPAWNNDFNDEEDYGLKNLDDEGEDGGYGGFGRGSRKV